MRDYRSSSESLDDYPVGSKPLDLTRYGHRKIPTENVNLTFIEFIKSLFRRRTTRTGPR